MSDLSEWIYDETPCGYCGHDKGWHWPPASQAEGCRVGQLTPDPCECAGWQE